MKEGDSVAREMLHAAWSSVARVAIAPVQDLLSLEAESRMNTPGRMEGNWVWRLTDDQLSDGLADALHEASFVYGRLPKRGHP
jgi:4-alpha-glucanotransferase